MSPYLSIWGRGMWRLWCALWCLLSRQTNLSLSRYGYWMSGNGTTSHSSFVVVYLIAHINVGSAQNGVFAVSQIFERIRFSRDTDRRRHFLLLIVTIHKKSKGENNL